MTPQERLADAVRQIPDEIVGHIALALQRVAKDNVANHGFQAESTAAFERIERVTDDIFAGR